MSLKYNDILTYTYMYRIYYNATIMAAVLVSDTVSA